MKIRDHRTTPGPMWSLIKMEYLMCTVVIEILSSRPKTFLLNIHVLTMDKAPIILLWRHKFRERERRTPFLPSPMKRFSSPPPFSYPEIYDVTTGQYWLCQLCKYEDAESRPMGRHKNKELSIFILGDFFPTSASLILEFFWWTFFVLCKYMYVFALFSSK